MFVGVMIVYNEIEFIEMNIRQHINCFDRIIVIDGADKRNNKDFISKTGLSNDGTKKEVKKLISEYGKKIEWHEMPFATKEEKAHFYITLLKDGDTFIRLDADQFYSFDDMERLKILTNQYDAVMYPIINFWKGLTKIIEGGYFSIKQCHAFKYYNGSKFEIDHVRLSYKDGSHYGIKNDKSLYTNDIVCYHMGFARKDTKRYKVNLNLYIERGEKITRPLYITCRESFLTDQLPPQCRILDYSGIYPEIFYKNYYPEIFTGKKGKKA